MLENVPFSLLLLDGSTDAANEIVMVVWFHKDGLSENVLTKIMYFRVCRRVSAAGVCLY